MSENTSGGEPSPPSAPIDPGPPPRRVRDPRRETWGIDHQDLGAMTCGLLAIMASVGSYYTVSVELPGGTFVRSFSAWHGLFGWLGAVLALAGSVLLLTRLFGVRSPLTSRAVVLGLYVVAACCTLLAPFAAPGDLCNDLVFVDGSCEAGDLGPGAAYWRTLIATLGGLLVTFLRRSAP